MVGCVLVSLGFDLFGGALWGSGAQRLEGHEHFSAVIITAVIVILGFVPGMAAGTQIYAQMGAHKVVTHAGLVPYHTCLLYIVSLDYGKRFIREQRWSFFKCRLPAILPVKPLGTAGNTYNWPHAEKCRLPL